LLSSAKNANLALVDDDSEEEPSRQFFSGDINPGCGMGFWRSVKKTRRRFVGELTDRGGDIADQLFLSSA
jgi:hypothetical protein